VPSDSRNEPGLTDELIRERTQRFVGREWVFAKVDAWLRDLGGPRVFLLAGGPGTGKTAIAARLVQISRGEVPAAGCPGLQRAFLAHYHFCQTGRDSTLSPLSFVQALSTSLANRFPAFRKALEEGGSQHINVSAAVSVAGSVQAGANVVGVSIDQVTVEIRGGDARPMFDQAVRRPLAALCDGRFAESIVILVDSLDEALTFSPDSNIVHLLRLVDDFPAQVRFLLTCRSNNTRVFELVGQPSVDLIADAPAGTDDVRAYAAARLSSLPDSARGELADRVAARSQGNFLYAYHVLNELTQSGASAAALSGSELPDGLEDVYRRFLKRELAASASRWGDVYRPLLGAIAVARGNGLTRAQLLGITGLPADRTDDALAVCREYLAGGERHEDPFRIYHASFREFLVDDTTFNIYPAERHAAVARWLLDRYGKSWAKCQDEYALRYAPLHLVEAARGSKAGRETTIRSLVEVTGNVRYQARVESLLRDLPMLQEHLVRAIDAASVGDDDTMLPGLMRACRNLVTFRSQSLRGDAVTALAERGAVQDAIARLPLFPDLDRDWHFAATLILAWLAIDANRTGAMAERNRVAGAVLGAEPLSELLARFDAAAAGQEPAAFAGGPVLDLDVGRQIVRRLSGQAFNRRLLALGGELLAPLGEQSELIGQRRFAAATDGPVLVNMARERGPEGTALLDEYIDAHAGYSYVAYRNRSLWMLLQAVLRHHPDHLWVRDRLKRVLVAALSGGVLEFAEMLPLVASLLVAKARTGRGTSVVDDFAKTAQEQLGQLRARRGANDTWSVHKRRLILLMEAEALGLGETATAQNSWMMIEELEKQRVLDGFAGFRAPAELRAADALRACGIGGKETVDARLLRAVECAHHIQDFSFCARVTARCNALARWHGTELDGAALEAAIERFANAPGDGEFAADHLVHEAYRFRNHHDPETLPIGPARDADTLDRLADVFQRPAVEFLRLNPGHGLAAVLAPGTAVRVPDPGFAPLLAVHLAARVVAETSLGLARAGLIRRLVAAASRNATALDSVLGYLLVAADPEDAGILDEIAREAGPVVLTEVRPPGAVIGPDSVMPT